MTLWAAFWAAPPFFTRFAYFFSPQFLCVCLCNCVRLVGQQRIRYLPIINASTSRCRVINHLFMISSQKDPYRFSRRSALTTGARTQTYTHTHTRHLVKEKKKKKKRVYIYIYIQYVATRLYSMDFLFGWASQLPNSLFSQCCWLPRCVRVREHGSNILKDYHIRPSTATTVYEPLMRGRALYRVFHVLLSLSLSYTHILFQPSSPFRFVLML